MRFIEEVVVEEFLPTVRSMLAERLREQGLTQRQVAQHLGISQSAVSKYANRDVNRNERIATDEQVREVIEEIAAGLASEEMRPVQALVELEVLIRELESGGLLADIHRERVPELADYDTSFDVHDPDSRLRTAEQTLMSVRRGLTILERTSGFASLIPNVGSNLVACTPDPGGIDDVAGVPGRILDVKGRAEVPGDPEFGVSEHVATVLLAARAGGSTARGGINVAYDDALVSYLDATGHDVVEFDAEAPLDEAVQAAIEREPAATVVYQTGGFGVEPILYLLGPTPQAVAETIREWCLR